MPGGRNVSRNIAEYKKKHPTAKPAQAAAVGYSEARAAGAKVPRKKKRKTKRK